MAGEKILVVEDDTMLAELASMVLVKEGYNVKIASDGLAALDTAAVWRPDLILLDVMMPGMHGYSVAERLREMENTKHTPIMMLTAKQSIEDKARGFESGADDYLTKPFENAELLLRIRALLRRAQQVNPNLHDNVPMGRIVTFFSLRGGSGCTSLACNTATGLSMLWREPVALLDLAMPIGACDVMLNLKPRHNLGGLARQDLSEIDYPEVQGYLTRHETGMSLLGGIANPAEADLVTEDFTTFVLTHLQRHFRYVVIDTSHNFTGPMLTALERSDEIILLMTPDIAAVRSTVATLKIFDELTFAREKTRVILNATYSENGLKADRIERVLGHTIDRVFFHDDTWTEAVNLGKPIILNDPASPLVSEIETFLWDVSSTEDRETEPGTPSDMWKRAQRRMRQKKPV